MSIDTMRLGVAEVQSNSEQAIRFNPIRGNSAYQFLPTCFFNTAVSTAAMLWLRKTVYPESDNLWSRLHSASLSGFQVR